MTPSLVKCRTVDKRSASPAHYAYFIQNHSDTFGKAVFLVDFPGVPLGWHEHKVSSLAIAVLLSGPVILIKIRKGGKAKTLGRITTTIMMVTTIAPPPAACMNINSVGGGGNSLGGTYYIVQVAHFACPSRVRPPSFRLRPTDSPEICQVWLIFQDSKIRAAPQSAAHCQLTTPNDGTQNYHSSRVPGYVHWHCCIACSLMQRRAGQVTALSTDIKESFSCGADMKC